jgi:hypothetical protein
MGRRSLPPFWKRGISPIPAPAGVATRLADDIRALEFGKRNLDEVLGDIVQHATQVPDNALLHESSVPPVSAARPGGC